MRAIIIPEGGTGIDALELVERPEPRLRPYQVLVRIRAAALNYRDLAIVNGRYFQGPVLRDLVPLSDAAGEVIAVGEGVMKWQIGDRVCATFCQIPPDGSPFASAAPLGHPLDGVLAEQVAFYENGLVPMPRGLSFEEAACLPCAGITAWRALFDEGTRIKPGDSVLILGTGGVSMFALHFARAAGARVIATSSSDEKLARVKQLGAAETINYKRIEAWDKEVMRLTHDQGVQCVVEVGGAGTIGRSFRAVGQGGKVCLIGVLSAPSADNNPHALMVKGASLHGIFVGSKAQFEAMNAGIEANDLHPLIDKTFPLDQARAAYAHQTSGNFMGKIVIKL